ncbi:MAG: tetratricopeptide repeat protein [Verrucomicrobiota bacterium]|nr:tetratricopeptide repeat protein [Limisphaera sp.]MDW8380712.1 tetratricopeptide repeat protein [Verrucomicrobiota bacterium]
MRVGVIHGVCLALALSWLGCLNSPAQSEEDDFLAAARAFEDELWERAERELAAFHHRYPDSPRRPLAVLLWAQALCRLGRPDEAVSLLETESKRAGTVADAFLFWRAEAEQQRGRFQAAASALRELLERFPDSNLRLEAAVNEAAAYAGMGLWQEAADRLGRTNGIFQQLAREVTDSKSETVARGFLLWAEALWHLGQPESALGILADLRSRRLPGLLSFRRQSLEIRCLTELKRVHEALQASSNLVSLAATLGTPAWEARSRLVQAFVLEAADDPNGALSLYSRNLAPQVPTDLQRESILKLSHLALAHGRFGEASQALETFLQTVTNSPVADLAHLALAELAMEQFLQAVRTGASVAPTQLLTRARQRLELIIGRFPDSPHRPRAELNRGWCLWLTGQWEEARGAFEEAALRLPPGPDRATALFKLGDIAFRMGRMAEAVSLYQAVVQLATESHAVRTQLCEPALYQMVRLAVELGDPAMAQEAVDRIVADFPDGFQTEAALTLQAQGLTRLGRPAAAREILLRILQRFPNTDRRAELQLAIARTYEFEGNWAAAVGCYRQWLREFPDHASAADVEFSLAWTMYRIGEETAAFAAFTNFLARYPNHSLTAQAQWWLADHHYRLGPAGYVEAERQYQLLAARYPSHPLAYEARMMAGRVAMARQAWGDAIGYFTNLTADLDCPVPLKIQALFAYGDAMRRLLPADTNAPWVNFEEAAKIFAKILEFNPTNTAAARAWGEIGECYLQLASRDPNFLAVASNAFFQAFSLPGADVSTRSQAWIGLGLVQERKASYATEPVRQQGLREAMNRYVDVFYGRHLRAGEEPDLFWTRRAGLEAVRVAEALQEWRQALRLYERIRDWLPALRPVVEKRLERVRERLTAFDASF